MRYIVDTKAKLLSPIHTGSDEVAGIDKTIRRREYLIGGETLNIPIVSANSIRGILRRVIAKDYLDLLGISDKSLTPDFYYTLFSGGALKKSDGKINISTRREFYKNIPMLHLLGSAIGNAILPGTLIVEDMLPIVKQTEQFTGVKSDIDLFEVVSEEFGTRRDDYPYKDEVETDKHQMLYRYEVLKAGVEMTFRVGLLSVANELDESVLKRGLMLMFKEARIGGKGAIGLGKVEFDISLKDDEVYKNYIEELKDEILEFLKENGFLV